MGSRCATRRSSRSARSKAAFEVDGERAHALILATGMLDATPAVEGFDAIYGVSAHTCPYCDGWEHQDTRIAVLGGGLHLGRLLRQWSEDVVVLGDVEPDERAELDAIGVPVVTEAPERFVHRDGHLTAIELAGREPLERDALFFFVRMEPRVAARRRARLRAR